MMGSMDIDQSSRDEALNYELRPVRPLESGTGLPYAPVDWPNPGDTWRWKVGPRINGKGHFQDRYIYPPMYLPGLGTETALKNNAFRSKRSLKRYISANFPEKDVETFFASFSWRIPSINAGIMPQKQALLPVYSSDEDRMHDNRSYIAVCKAGNDKCGSLSETESLPTMPCNICCGEPNFCSDCCCILCCKTISLEHKGYSYIKCEALVPESYICGHVAHLNCALRAYMAGTVGGNIGLDAEYCCRRCDAKMDLVPHVNRFLEICRNVEYQGDVEKILSLGICILRRSQREDAKILLNCIEGTVIELKSSASSEVVLNDDTPAIWSDFSDSGEAKDSDTVQSLQDVSPIRPMPFNHQAEMHKLEEEIREVLKALREAQESEYQIAEGRLHAQKDFLDDLYRQLEREKSELSRRVSDTNANDLMTNVLKRSEQIRKEVAKLREMGEVAKGFGRTPRGVLEDYFHLRIEDQD